MTVRAGSEPTGAADVPSRSAGGDARVGPSLAPIVFPRAARSSAGAQRWGRDRVSARPVMDSPIFRGSGQLRSTKRVRHCANRRHPTGSSHAPRNGSRRYGAILVARWQAAASKRATNNILPAGSSERVRPARTGLRPTERGGRTAGGTPHHEGRHPGRRARDAGRPPPSKAGPVMRLKTDGFGPPNPEATPRPAPSARPIPRAPPAPRRPPRPAAGPWWCRW